MFLQQSCLWLEGWQGIVRQHFIACWSADMAWHSESCITNATLAATRNDVNFRNICFWVFSNPPTFYFMVIGRARQENGPDVENVDWIVNAPRYPAPSIRKSPSGRQNLGCGSIDILTTGRHFKLTSAKRTSRFNMAVTRTARLENFGPARAGN